MQVQFKVWLTPRGLPQIKTLEAQDCRAPGGLPALLTCHTGAQSRGLRREKGAPSTGLGPSPCACGLRALKDPGPAGGEARLLQSALNILQPRGAAQVSAGPLATRLGAKGEGVEDGRGRQQASSLQHKPPGARRSEKGRPRAGREYI